VGDVRADGDDEADAGTGDEAPVDGAPTADAADDAAEGDLAGRARRLADGATDRSPPAPLEDRPGTTTVQREEVPPRPGGDDLASIAQRWETILDVVADDSRRAKAFYEPATPIRLHNGVLLLSYPSTRRFHAEQGKGGEMTAFLASAIQQVTGLERIRVDVRLEDGGPRRPSPAPVDGPARDEPPAEEQAAVAEAEEAPPAAPADADEVDQLLRDQLGAEPLPDDE
jgi:hypothetical protein